MLLVVAENASSVRQRVLLVVGRALLVVGRELF